MRIRTLIIVLALVVMLASAMVQRFRRGPCQ
jgi:hypothetical protein